MTPTTEPQHVSTGAPRSSSKRNLVLAVLEEGEGFRSAQDIHATLRVEGQKIGLATIYRVLQQLSTSGDVDVLRNEGGEATYRSCSETHHHHLVCRVCGKTVEVKGPAVERWTEATAEKHGFRDVSHTVEIFGVCSDH